MSKKAAALLLGLVSAVLGPVQGQDALISPVLGGSSSPTMVGNGLPPVSCVTKGQMLNRGACAGFTGYFRNNPNCSSDQVTFKAAVLAGPVPSTMCCANAVDFTASGCSCDPAITEQADAGQVSCVVRATLTSPVCNPSASLQNPCTL